MNRQKHYTKSERHARLVRFEKKFKQRNISEFGRMIRLSFIRQQRLTGRMKRATQRRKIRAIEHRMWRSMGWERYGKYKHERRKSWGKMWCIFPEPKIG